MKPRLALFTAFVALACASFAQEPNPQVTFSTKAVTVDKAIAAIAKQTGTKIAASPAISKEVVLIAVTDVPLEALLTRIADVVSGEWKVGSDGIRYLNYDDSVFRARSRAANERRAENLKKYLVETLKQAAEMKAAQEEAAKGGGEEGGIEEGGEEIEEGEQGEAIAVPEAMGFPWVSADTHVIRILSRIDPRVLVGVSDARIVFSSNPTRTQRQLPNVADIITDLIKEHNESAIAIQKAKNQEAEEDPRTVEQKAQEQQMEELFGGFMGGGNEEPINAPPAKVMLVVTRGGSMFGNGEAELTLFDGTGKKIYSASANVELSENSGSLQAIVEAVVPGAEGEPAPPVDTTKKIEYSPESLEMMKVFDMNAMAAMFGENAPTLSEGLMAKLREPDVYDPLSFGPSDALLFLAKDRNLDVVTALPDAVTGMADLMVSKELTVGAFVDNLQKNDALAVETKDGWFTVRPFDPESTKFFRVDRKALSKLIVAGDKGSPSMEDLAAYALENESPMKTEVVMVYFTLFTPSVFADMMMGSRGWSGLRLYGTLSPSQRDTLKASGGIPFGTLTPGQRGHVETLLYGVETALQVNDPTKPKSDLPEFMRMAATMFGGNGKDYRTEPTEVMPNGLPSGGVITGLLQTKPIMTPAKGLMSKMGFDASMIAMFQFAMTQPEAAGELPDFGGLRLGSRTTLEMHFVVAPNIEQTERLSSDAPSADKTVYAMDNLPPVIRAAVEAEMAKLKKLGMFGGGGGF